MFRKIERNKPELGHIKAHFLNICHMDLVLHQANRFGAVPCYPFIAHLPQNNILC